MQKQKKKSPGRPKKEFISKKPRVKIKSGPGRPRKVPLDVVWFVDKSVDNSQKKDLIILWLFFLSFALFVGSMYVTFMRDTPKDAVLQAGLSDITNIATGNIDYNNSTGGAWEEFIKPVLQTFSPEQQMIIDFYQAVNDVDTNALYKLTDARLEQSNVFKTYYNKRRLSNFFWCVRESGQR